MASGLRRRLDPALIPDAPEVCAVHATFFRSFYLIFSALFGMLFFAAAAIVLTAARHGDYPSTIVGVGVTTLCGMLISRALNYMRE